jgi:hypothetical protein
LIGHLLCALQVTVMHDRIIIVNTYGSKLKGDLRNDIVVLSYDNFLLSKYGCEISLTYSSQNCCGNDTDTKTVNGIHATQTLEKLRRGKVPHTGGLDINFYKYPDTHQDSDGALIPGLEQRVTQY